MQINSFSLTLLAIPRTNRPERLITPNALEVPIVPLTSPGALSLVEI